MNNLGGVDIHIDFYLVPALPPVVEPDAGGEVLLAAAEEGLVDGGGVGAGGELAVPPQGEI